MLKEYLKSIADAIRTKKGTTSDIPALNFPAEIRSIEGGSNNVSSGRPSEWLYMPAVSENEIYLLLHVAPPAENFVAFLVECIGSYTVEYGTVENGSFVSAGSQILASGTIYEGTFLYSDCANEMSNGIRQVMLRITGTIFSFMPYEHEQRGRPNFRVYNIVEFKGNLPNCIECSIGASQPSMALICLRYFTLEGANNITDFSYMFSCCNSLVRIFELDTSRGTDFNEMFGECYALDTCPQFDTRKGTNFNYMLANCQSLKTAVIDVSSVSSANNLFNSCYTLSSLIMTGTNTTYPTALSISGTALTAQAIRDLFNALPAITVSRVIGFSNTPAVYEFRNNPNLANEIIAIASGKGWSVAY